MECETYRAQLDAYLDGELSRDEASTTWEHLRGCSDCAVESLNRVQLKRAVHAVGQRFQPDPAFRARIRNQLSSQGRSFWIGRNWSIAFATAVVLVVFGVLFLTLKRGQENERRLISELVDLHVATLASSNPMDVVSSDRHTVKPWFQGRIPFTFNLPEMQKSSFDLVGGRLTYLSQAPGAQIMFRIRQHQISLFIFPEDQLRKGRLSRANEMAWNHLQFNVRSWMQDGLRYFMVSDASSQDIDALAKMVKSAS